MSSIDLYETECKWLREQAQAPHNTSTVLHIHGHHCCLGQQKPRFEAIATCISHLYQPSHLGCWESLRESRYDAQVTTAHHHYICLTLHLLTTFFHCAALIQSLAHPSELTILLSPALHYYWLLCSGLLTVSVHKSSGSSARPSGSKFLAVCPLINCLNSLSLVSS